MSEPTADRAAGPLAPESLARLVVDGGGTVHWSCTPLDLAALAAGWLVCEGIVERPEDLLHLEPSEATPLPTVEAHLSHAARGRLAGVLTRSPGTVVFPAGRPQREGPAPEMRLDPGVGDLLEDGDRVAGLFERMFERAPLRESVGGVHTGGLVRRGELLAVVEDVSRHHVVDRLVGRAWLAGTPLHDSVFLLSARISGAMAAKACRAGVAALVSRSIPSELAASIAGAAGLFLVGRAQRGTPFLYRPRR